jgi:hypothetical protein
LGHARKPIDIPSAVAAANEVASGPSVLTLKLILALSGFWFSLTIVRHNEDMLHSSKRSPEWTSTEVDRLLQLAKKRANAARAAKLLGRRIGSVRRQARLLGILLYKK